MSNEFTADDFTNLFPQMFEKDTRVFQLQTLKARHQRMIDLHLMGMKNTEIALTLNITTVSVGDCLNSELGKASIEIRRENRDEVVRDHQEQVERITEESLQVVQDVIMGEGDGAEASIALRTKTALDMIKKKIPDLAVTKVIGDQAYLQQFNIGQIIMTAKEVDRLPEIIDVQKVAEDS